MSEDERAQLPHFRRPVDSKECLVSTSFVLSITSGAQNKNA